MATSRIANTLRGAMPGLSRGLQAGLQGRAAYQQGFDAETALQSQLAQAAARVMQSQAAADKDAAGAEKTRFETDLLGRRPEMVEELAALGSDSDIPVVRAVREALRTGRQAMIPGKQLEGPTKTGEPLGAMVPAEQRSRIAQQLMRLAPVLMGTGDIKVDDWAKAQGGYREMDLGEDVMSGRRTAGQVGAAQAAVAGRPLYNSDASGAVLDLFGGALATDNPMAQSAIGVRRGQEVMARAGAAENYAQAGKAREETTQIRAGGASSRLPAGYRLKAGGVPGELEPIPGGPADPNTKGAKQTKPPTEGQAKSLMFASRMAAADEIIGELERKGTKMPSMLKRAAEAVPLVGTGLGMVANTFTTSGEQEYEQAQADFINAILRKESGAVISDQEFARAVKQYFPEPNDDAQKRRQKAANRKTAIAGLKAEFGEAFLPEFDKIVGEARKQRTNPSDGGASGGFGSPDGGGWKIERVN